MNPAFERGDVLARRGESGRAVLWFDVETVGADGDLERAARLGARGAGRHIEVVDEGIDRRLRGELLAVLLEPLHRRPDALGVARHDETGRVALAHRERGDPSASCRAGRADGPRVGDARADVLPLVDPGDDQVRPEVQRVERCVVHRVSRRADHTGRRRTAGGHLDRLELARGRAVGHPGLVLRGGDDRGLHARDLAERTHERIDPGGGRAVVVGHDDLDGRLFGPRSGRGRGSGEHDCG